RHPTAPPTTYTLSLHDALPISARAPASISASRYWTLKGRGQAQMTRPIKVLLVDDHEMVRIGLSAVLSTEEDLEVVGEAAGGARSEEHTSELQSRENLVCRLLL